MKLLLVVLLLVTSCNASYTFRMFNCNNTSCEDAEYRGGPVVGMDCDPDEPPKCMPYKETGGLLTYVCLNHTSDFAPEHVVATVWPSSNTNCTGEPAAKYIMRTGLCEEKWTFQKNSTHVTVQVYDNTLCDGNSVDHHYEIGSCSTNTHYGATVLFETDMT